jgi:cysteine desulfurase
MSTQRRVYLDFNATAPLVPAARDAMVAAMGDAGNPSSIHAEGRRMRDRVERARNQVAALVGRPREQIVFTSGGTEANWLGVMALAAAAERRGLPRVIATTSIEHPSLLGAVHSLSARGWEVVTVRYDNVAALPERPPSVLAVALVNHELGTVLPGRIFDWASPSLVHLDVVQAAGKRDIDRLEATHSIALSGHKIGASQGVGALALSIDDGLPVFEGGHQERGRRPGTENTLGIIGMGAAVGALDRAAWDRSAELGRWFEGELRGLGARIHGESFERTHTTVNAAWAGARGESIVMALDLEGISVSTGAACTSGSIQPSRVLLGLGLSEEQAREGVRFSLGPTTTENELKRVLEVLVAIVERARRHR